MRTSEENIRQLLEMLDNPDAYTEQEIHDIINRDEDTLETYRLMVEAKRSSRHRLPQNSVDVDAAWRSFNQKLQPKPHTFGWLKVAASLIGVILVSGITFAAVNIVRQYQKTETPRAEVSESVTNKVSAVPTDTFANRDTSVQPVIYDNIPLEKMLTEIAAHYDVEVTFASDEVRKLRFHFVWNPKQNIESVVRDLNRFKRLHVTLKDNQLNVE